MNRLMPSSSSRPTKAGVCSCSYNSARLAGPKLILRRKTRGSQLPLSTIGPCFQRRWGRMVFRSGSAFVGFLFCIGAVDHEQSKVLMRNSNALFLPIGEIFAPVLVTDCQLI